MGTSGRAKNIDQDYNYTRSMFNVYCTGHEYSLFDCSYDIKTEKGSFTLRNKSASNLSDGSKPRWTIDVPNKLLGMKNGKGTSEIKFE
jgi:hypothetical protein